ncbi:Schlafen-like protein 1 [Bulinus truncatus]|nr:Schlafen-like protein 1 [Bulinus truncatus]
MNPKTPSNQDTHGIVLRPVHQNVSPDVLAKHVYNLFSSLGIRGGDVRYIMVSSQGGYVKVGLSGQEVEDYALKVLREVVVVMGRYDLRNITKKPQLLLVEKLKVMSGQDGVEKKYQQPTRPTSVSAAKSAITRPPSLPQQQPHTSTRPTSGAANSSKQKPHAAPRPGPSFSESKIRPSPAPSPKTAKTGPDPPTHLPGDPRPTLVSVKTSTALVQPCDCPETVFYHHRQQVGTETRHAEFKKGGVLHDKKSFRAIVGKYMCGFLNSEGGTIYFGVSDIGDVVGVDVNSDMEQSIRKDIVYTAHLIEPHVSSRDFSVNFARVMDQSGELSNDLKVLEVCVRPREPPKRMYSYKDIIYMRRDGSLQNLGQVQYYTG